MATKRNKALTQNDLFALEERLVNRMTTVVKSVVKTETRKEVKAAEKRIIKTLVNKMEVLLENRGSEWLGVTGEEVKLMKNKQDDQEERITTVEQKIGLRA